MRDPRGPEAAAGSTGGGDPGETKPGGSQQVIRGSKRQQHWGSERLQRDRERQRPAPAVPPRVRGAPWLARGGLLALPTLGQ